jgi:hypothetical protein
MGKKNPDLCERPYCRHPYTKVISGYTRYFGGKRWTLRVCDEHAAGYGNGGFYQDTCGNHGIVRERK